MNEITNTLNQDRLSESRKATTFQQAYEEFRLRCDSRNLSSGTLAWYHQILGGLERFLVQRYGIASMEGITAGHIRAHLSQLKARELSSETVHRTYGGLRCFFKFLLREGLIRSNPMELVERPKRERHLIQPLQSEHVRTLLAQADPKSFLGLRNKVLMLLMLDSGLRLSEALKLRLPNVDVPGGTVLVMGKGRKERRVPFAKVTRQALEAYLVARRRIVVPSDLLFISRHGGELTSRHVQIMIKRYGERAGIQGVRVSPHTLRHTCATQYIINGGDPFSLQQILGHSTLEMVRQYVHLANRDVYDAHRRYSPMDRLLANTGLYYGKSDINTIV
ncbi:MAG: tyrosine-type recombinase/integrase [Elusimicrobia bacterium]|nr:tyrosine-type recombinase/integrase [Elusimicrobiota bacterium]